MKHLSNIALALTLSLGATGAAMAQSASTANVKGKAGDVRLAAGEIQVRVKVVELDTAHRLASLKGPRGQVVTVEVPAEVKNFDQVRVGDELVVRYTEAIAAKIEKTSSKGIREQAESTATATATPGALPGVGVQRTIEVLAVITALDPKTRTATLRGAKRTFTVEAPKEVDLAKLKVGDEVRAVLVQAIVLNVERVGSGK
jgi:hypothetical protein